MRTSLSRAAAERMGGDVEPAALEVVAQHPHHGDAQRPLRLDRERAFRPRRRRPARLGGQHLLGEAGQEVGQIVEQRVDPLATGRRARSRSAARHRPTGPAPRPWRGRSRAAAAAPPAASAAATRNPNRRGPGARPSRRPRWPCSTPRPGRPAPRSAPSTAAGSRADWRAPTRPAALSASASGSQSDRRGSVIMPWRSTCSSAMLSARVSAAPFGIIVALSQSQHADGVGQRGDAAEMGGDLGIGGHALAPFRAVRPRRRWCSR